MGRCTSPPPPLGQRGSRFRGPFFETNNVSILTSIAYAKRTERHSIAKRIPAGSEDVDYWPTTNGFVAVEDEGDRGSQSLSIALNIKLEDIKLAEQTADTAITFQTRLATQRSVSPPHFLDVTDHAPQRSVSPPHFLDVTDHAPQRSLSPPHFLDVTDHAPQRSLSPPPFFEMKDRRVGASRQLQRRPACRCRPLASRQFVQRRSVKMDFLASRQLVQCRSIAKRIPAGSEVVDHCPTTNGFVAVEDEGDQGSQSLSIAPNKKVEDIKLAEQAADTAITFQTRLAPHRSVSPPHLLDVAEHAPQKSISPPPFFEMKDRRVGASRQLQRRPARRCRPLKMDFLASRQLIQRRSIKLDFLASRQFVQRRSIAKRISARSEDVDHCPTTNGFVAVEDEGDQGRQSLSIAPNIKLEDIKLDEQAADTAITSPTRLAPQRSVSPPHFLDVAEHAPQRSITPPPFFEMKDRRVRAILTRRQLVQRRYKSGDFASLIENGGGEERNYRTNNSSNASVDAITSPYQEAPPPKLTRSPLPPTTRTTVDFTARLAPLPARKARDFIASIFKKKRQMEIFASPIEKEQSVEVEPRPTSFGLAHIFSYEELKEATSCFKQQIGDGGFSSVYLGKLPDQRMVAVKVLYEGIPKRFEQFINEVTVLSRLRHKNLVVLYGCTDPETKKLLLVYEFMPNGTIADHLHGKRPPLTWAVRIQMAIETAEALAYLHSLEPPIIHRDVKTSNILLDNDFHVKVADLGMCRLLPWDSKSVTTQPQGTQGYRDPEYELYCNLTDKSDVYSFGVVLLELLSGQQAVDVNREKNDIYLFRMALNMIQNKELEQLVDPKLVYHSDCEIKRMIDLVAQLAWNCLQPEADMRPSMLDVVSALKKIYNDM